MLRFRHDQQTDQEASKPRAGSTIYICPIPGVIGISSSALPLPKCRTQDIRYRERVEQCVSHQLSFCGPEISPNLGLALMTKEFPHRYRKQHTPTSQDMSLLSVSCLSLTPHHLSSHPDSTSLRFSCSWSRVIHLGIGSDNLFTCGIYAECQPFSQLFPSR